MMEHQWLKGWVQQKERGAEKNGSQRKFGWAAEGERLCGAEWAIKWSYSGGKTSATDPFGLVQGLGCSPLTENWLGCYIRLLLLDFLFVPGLFAAYCTDFCRLADLQSWTCKLSAHSTPAHLKSFPHSPFHLCVSWWCSDPQSGR